MTAAGTAPAPASAAWKITGGHPDALETAAVMAVLTALLSRSQEPPAPETAPTAALGRYPTNERTYPHTGTWRSR